uniref:epithelial membrane protein 2-like n=1 Tax=Myxine glutinosa TaxID=7769 RepID=UPI00358F2DE3
MFPLLIFIFFLHILNITLMCIGTIDSSWWVGESSSTDLWWWYNNGSVFKPVGDGDDWLQAVRALMVLAVIFACLGLGLFVYQLYQLEKGGRFIITGVFTLLASLLAMTAAAIYTSYGSHRSGIMPGNYGHSFIITWVAFALTFINSMVYLALRKRS